MHGSILGVGAVGTQISALDDRYARPGHGDQIDVRSTSMVIQHALDAKDDALHLLFVALGGYTSGLKVLLERQGTGQVDRYIDVRILTQRKARQTRSVDGKLGILDAIPNGILQLPLQPLDGLLLIPIKVGVGPKVTQYS